MNSGMTFLRLLIRGGRYFASRESLGQIAHGSLAERNKAISKEIKRELTAPRLMSAVPLHPSVTSLGKTGIDIFTHQHEILPGVWLGDYRSYLSLDSAFHTEHPCCMVDPIEDIYDSTISEVQRREYKSLDFEGTTYLGIKHVISATRFTPAASVAVDDWSRFEPDLETAGIQHTRIAVDDDDFAWDGIQPHLNDIFEKIDSARNNEEPILIHCVKGASRSATVLIAYMMRTFELTYDEAFTYVQTRRSQVESKPSLTRGLKAYGKKLKEERDRSRLFGT
ncbi:MAG: dual specificity protein phosphatase family protein [Chlamydiales bacterium]|nr:dual specificity protein phosphatase family protein [Chlamydiales bacterium]